MVKKPLNMVGGNVDLLFSIDYIYIYIYIYSNLQLAYNELN